MAYTTLTCHSRTCESKYLAVINTPLFIMQYVARWCSPRATSIFLRLWQALKAHRRCHAVDIVHDAIASLPSHCMFSSATLCLLRCTAHACTFTLYTVQYLQHSGCAPEISRGCSNHLIERAKVCQGNSYRRGPQHVRGPHCTVNAIVIGTRLPVVARCMLLNCSVSLVTTRRPSCQGLGIALFTQMLTRSQVH